MSTPAHDRHDDPPAALDRAMLDRAARAALRAQGRTSPNPIVGCVLRAESGEIVTARHARFGDRHAEAAAIELAGRRGVDTRGATMWVTLEPCDHHGKTPPCSRAIIDAGVREVIVAAADPSELAAGGFRTLREAGVTCRYSDASELADAVSQPFLINVERRRPFVIAKWAQTLDGKFATRTGDSKWITGAAARRDVHRLRARTDAIITGVGSVIADDSLLTARDVPLRRTARRVVLDSSLELRADAAIVRSAGDAAPVTVVADQDAIETKRAHAADLRAAGVDLRSAPTAAGGLDLRHVLSELYEQHAVTNAMLEAGPGLVSAFLADDLIDEARAYVAPMIVGDREAKAIEASREDHALASVERMRLLHVRRFGDDVRLLLRRAEPLVSPRPVDAG